MNLLYFLLEANAYLIVFYAFYKLVLQRETFYSLNRFYLLTTIGLSFLMPFLDLSAIRGTATQEIYTGEMVMPVEKADFEWWQIAFAIYVIIVLGLLFRLATRIYSISTLIKSGDVITHGHFKEVQITDKNLSFSFFNYLFINPTLKEQDTIKKHEMVHINQRHSLDILFIELIQSLNWFNPIIPLIKTDLKAVHEFIADEIVSKEDLGSADYAMFLIHNSYGVSQPHLSNQMFNQSLLKKRIMKLSQKKSDGLARLKYIVPALLIPGMLCVTALSFSKSYGIMDLMPEKTLFQDTLKKRANSSAPAKAYGSKPSPNRPSPPPPSVERGRRISGKNVPPPPPVQSGKRMDFRLPPPPPTEPRKNDGNEIPPPPPPLRPGEVLDSKDIPPPPPPIDPEKQMNITIPPPPPPVDPGKRMNITIPSPRPQIRPNREYKAIPVPRATVKAISIPKVTSTTIERSQVELKAMNERLVILKATRDQEKSKRVEARAVKLNALKEADIKRFEAENKRVLKPRVKSIQ